MPTNKDARPIARSTSRRAFLEAAGASVAAFPRLLEARTSAGGDELCFLSATALAERIRSRATSAEEAVRACLRRIHEVNPKINAVVALCEERALREARAADEALARGQMLGPLHGVPMTIKDSLETEGVVSTGGTLGRKDFVPREDSTVVAKLRAAGAILLGKSNTPELTIGGGGRGTTNLIYGATKNPYDLAYQPGASSGGSAAIVAAGGAPFDIGSDYGGSIRGPCHVCGLAGVKPTSGRVSRIGHVLPYGGYYDSYQQLGPIARRVEDLFLVLPVISGPDGRDAAVVPMPPVERPRADPRKIRVAFHTTNGVVECAPEIAQVVKGCAAYLDEAGCRITEDRPPAIQEAMDVYGRLEGADGRARVRRLLLKLGTRETSPGLAMDGGEVVSSEEFVRLTEALDDCRTRMLSWLQAYDLVIAPVAPTGARTHDAGPFPKGYFSYTIVYSIAGWPAAVVRAGTDARGLPLGVQIVGRPWQEGLVLAAAELIESRTGGWRKPPL